MKPSSIVMTKDGKEISREPCTQGHPSGRNQVATPPAIEASAASESDGGDKSSGDGDADQEEEPSRHARIVAATRALDVSNPGLWTAHGLPRVDALENVLQMPITQAERDSAWQAVKE